MIVLLLQTAFLIMAITLLGIYVWWQKRTNFYLSGLKSLNGPINMPIMGGLYIALPIRDALWKVSGLHEKYGSTFKTAAPYAVAIFTIDPNFIKFIMTTMICINKGYTYKFLSNWLGEGLLLSRSSKWRTSRKMLTPAFHFKILEDFYDIFHRNNSILIAQLTKTIDQGPIDVYHYITLCVLDNINETSMGTTVNAQLNSNSDYVRATKFMTRLFFSRMVSPYKFIDCIYAFTSDYHKEKKALKILHDYTLSVIISRRKQCLTNFLQSNQSEQRQDRDEFEMKKRKVFLDVLLEASIDGEPLTDEEIREQVDTFMFEGHDTVSAGIAFCLFMVSKHAEIQDKLIDEQIKVLGRDKLNPTSNDLKQMTYLECVIKESLRLFPSVPIITRIVMEDFNYANFYVRKDTELAIPILALHRSPKLYPDPLKFDPERFTQDEQLKRHPFAYLPFSAGHRNCIGQQFAMIQMKLVISCILREFELSSTIPEHVAVIPSAIVLYSENGLLINMKKRNL